ncbi:MAG TPA: hypothetical protein EYN91_21920 [Candidatus Melainabacteria bacterium]|nr:hypothetical protein [Candidatus Melainabacteria bacterium]
MHILNSKHTLVLTYIGIVIFVFWTASGQGQQIHRHPSVSLAGLTGVDLSEIGPWVLNENFKIEEVHGLSDALHQAANERLMGIVKTGSNGVSSDKNPKLKLFLDYGNKPNLALRGGRHLKSIKLVLEDEVRLERDPPKFMRIVSWSCDRDQSAGETRKKQILDTFTLLLDEFKSDYGRERQGNTNLVKAARTAGRI